MVVGLGERNLLPGHVREWGHHGGLQGDRGALMAPVDDSFAGFQKNNSLGGCRGERFINKKRSLFPGHVRKPSHHGGLQGAKIIMVVPVDDPRTSAPPIFWETVNGTSIGTTITLLAP